jgi:hypothetical protein
MNIGGGARFISRTRRSSALPRRVVALLSLSGLALLVLAMTAEAAVPVPTVSIPAAGRGIAFDTTSIDLANFGYTEHEFLVSGDAHAFVNTATLGENGIWAAAPGVSSPFTTRILVRTPENPADFNGTVIVEWLNVSGGVDAAPEWDYSHVELLRSGYAWVGVTAQFDGAQFLPEFDSVRYASIFHPGDSFSYDIYSQGAQAILQGNPRPLGALTPLVRRVLATGESQSASRMMTYYNAVQPVARVFNGFLIHSAGSGADLSQSLAGAGVLGGPSFPAPAGVPATPDIPVPPTAFIRGDLAQPVQFVNTETDITVLGAGFSVHNQPDSGTFRMWEIAGATHADSYLLEFAGADAAASGLPVPPFDCGNPPTNNGPAETFVLRAAFDALNRWTGIFRVPPPIGPRLATTTVTAPEPEVLIDRNPATGNAIGGIQLPPMAVPIGTLTGIRPPAAVAANENCILFGAASPWDGGADPWDGVAGIDPAPFPAPSLAKLYGTKQNYVDKFAAATASSIFQGFLLWADVFEMIGLAEEAEVPQGSANNAAIIPDP